MVVNSSQLPDFFQKSASPCRQSRHWEKDTTYLSLLMRVAAYQWNPTIWQCAAWSRPVWYPSTGWPYWANGSAIGHARKLPLALRVSFLSMAVPAVSLRPGNFNFLLVTANRVPTHAYRIASHPYWILPVADRSCCGK